MFGFFAAAKIDNDSPRLKEAVPALAVVEDGRILRMNLPEPHQSWRDYYGRLADVHTPVYIVDAREWHELTKGRKDA